MNSIFFLNQDCFAILPFLKLLLGSIISFFTICSCNLNSYNYQTEGMTYRDFDFSTMRPVSPMYDNITYPLVRIEQTETSLQIQFEYDNECKRKLNLSLVSDSLWVSHDSVIEEYTHYFKKFYLPGKSYSVEYSNSDGKLEIEALLIEVHSERKFYTYNLFEKINVRKMLNEPWGIDLGKATRVHEHNWELLQEGNVIRSNGKIIIDKVGDSQVGNESQGCWEINGHPHNFFNFFPWKYKKVDCP